MCSSVIVCVCVCVCVSAPICLDLEVRLTDGESETEGNLQMCLDNSWVALCDRDWGNAQAMVICNQLGFQSEGIS